MYIDTTYGIYDSTGSLINNIICDSPKMANEVATMIYKDQVLTVVETTNLKYIAIPMEKIKYIDGNFIDQSGKILIVKDIETIREEAELKIKECNGIIETLILDELNK